MLKIGPGDHKNQMFYKSKQLRMLKIGTWVSFPPHPSENKSSLPRSKQQYFVGDDRQDNTYEEISRSKQAAVEEATL